MNHNLAWTWGDECSLPKTPFLAFYSPQSGEIIPKYIKMKKSKKKVLTKVL